MERRILCLLGLAVCAMVVTTCMASKDKGDAEWEAFKAKKGKKYKDDKEEGERKEKFMKNLEKVEKQNKDHDEGKSSWRAALNDFADMSEEEFMAKKTGFKRPTVEEMKGLKVLPPIDNVKRQIDIPDDLDYRADNLVTRVRNQGSCGSCYGFSAVGALEALHKRNTGTLLELSEQWIVDCADNSNPGGCAGGQMAWAFYDVAVNGGIPKLSDYAYTGEESACQDKTDVDVTITDYPYGLDVPEALIQEWLVATGIPQTVSICMNGANEFYAGGVFSSWWCDCPANHAVLIVGWGVSALNETYWILKNSYGDGWGDNGYMLMERDAGMCDFGSYFAIVY